MATISSKAFKKVLEQSRTFMLKGHEKFRMIDQSKKNDFFAEVNWNPKDENINDCKIVKFTFPDGSEAFVDKKHLIEMLFAIGSREEQKDMIPQKTITTQEYETIVEAKATKDIRKGDPIVFPFKFRLPFAEEEFIGSVNEALKKNKLVVSKNNY